MAGTAIDWAQIERWDRAYYLHNVQAQSEYAVDKQNRELVAEGLFKDIGQSSFRSGNEWISHHDGKKCQPKKSHSR